MALTNGLVVMTPTSTDVTGTGSSATINSNGSVTFSSCSTLSLNGVFTTDYDNYMIVMRNSTTSVSGSMRARLRASGTDSTATSDYNYQGILVAASSQTTARTTTTGYWLFNTNDNDWHNGFTAYLFGPKLAQPTAYRTVTIDSVSGAQIYDAAGTHELSTAYDGITMYTGNASETNTGLVTVFGFNQ